MTSSGHSNRNLYKTDNTWPTDIDIYIYVQHNIQKYQAECAYVIKPTFGSQMANKYLHKFGKNK